MGNGDRMKCPYCNKEIEGGYPALIVHCDEVHNINSIQLYRKLFISDWLKENIYKGKL